MTATQILVISLVALVVLAVAGAFAIAYRRSSGKAEPWRRRVPREAARADQSELRVPVAVGAVTTEAAEAPPPDAVTEVPSAPEAAPEPVVVPVVRQVQRLEQVSTEEAGVTRRQFFTRALLATFGAYLGLFGLTSLAFIWPRLSGGFGSDIDAGPIEEMRSRIVQADGSIIPLFFPEARAYIVPFDESVIGQSQFEGKAVVAAGLTALFQRCVHLGCRVPWCATSQGFECPCHGSKYNAVGEYQAGPAPRNLDRFVVDGETGNLIIKTGSIIQTARAPVDSVAYPQGPSCIALDAGGG
ncbi:MAG: Rieske 2Fe-2S domain-containing protein [Acidimicrobiia bacterium]|nr:Rieske 2Fe-2S domain-containing protein [Acidimicrobiia bacterium]